MRRGSHIVAVSSLGSTRYVKDYSVLGIAKAALESAVRYLGVELASLGIHVNAVSGGPVDTEGLRKFPDFARRKKECLSLTPWKRLGTPEDMAQIVAFLCKPESAWICGQTIIADGGLSLRLLSL